MKDYRKGQKKYQKNSNSIPTIQKLVEHTLQKAHKTASSGYNGTNLTSRATFFMQYQRATVYASSSSALADHYYDAAARLGKTLAAAKMEIIYGGGRYGLMGAMADAALAAGAQVEGVIPDFLMDLEVGHQELSRLTVVGDLHTRKRLMLDGSDAVFCLPGGCGTFEELFEAMTFKRLGLFLGPIVLVNTTGYYNQCIEFLHQCTAERFMSERHLAMWQVINEPEEALTALATAPPWTEEERQHSAVKLEG